jgi:hypothetical protein
VRPEKPASCAHAVQEVPFAASADDVVQLVTHLYLCQGLSTYKIGEMTGMDRQRVGRLLARAGVPVKPRGAGRHRRRDEKQVARDTLMARLYAESRWTSGQISALTGVSERAVRSRLRAGGVRMRTRGRVNREDRVSVPADELIRLYVADGLSAADTGRLLGISGQTVLRAAHDEGLPVRVGGPEPGNGPWEIELVNALYADPLVRNALTRYGIPSRLAGGPIWQRFPVPIPVSPQLAKDLYVGCGLGVRHIELLTGQPSQTLLRLLEAHGIARRPAGGRTPFMRRWRAGSQAASATPDGLA